MNNVKISVITVCYNAEKTIARAMDSVIRQDYGNIEYIIVDGKSTDDTLSIISDNIDNVDCLISESDQGIYDAMNKGIKRATGDWIAFLNSDDIYLDNAISQIAVECENVSNEVGIIAAQINFVEDDFIVGRSKYDSFEKIWMGMPVAHPASFVRKEVFEKVGLFDTTYEIAGDYDFFFRCYINKIKCKFVNFITTNFSIFGVSGRERERLYQEDKLILNKYSNYCCDKEVIEKSLLNKEKLVYFSNVKRATITKLLTTVSKIYIWGTGYWGNSIASTFDRLNVSYCGFIDNDRKKVDKIVKNHVVYSPDALDCYLEKDTAIIIAVEGAFDNIKEQICCKRYEGKIINYLDFIDRIYEMEATANIK